MTEHVNGGGDGKDCEVRCGTIAYVHGTKTEGESSFHKADRTLSGKKEAQKIPVIGKKA